MNPRTMLTRLTMSAAGLLLVVAPTYAHWGAISPWAFAEKNQTVYCTHGTSGASNYRRVQLATAVAIIWLDGPNGTVFPFPIEAATLKNVSPSGSADVFAVGYDDANPPGSYFPYMGTINNLARNSTASFGTVVGKTSLFSNLQAACETSDNML